MQKWEYKSLVRLSNIIERNGARDMGEKVPPFMSWWQDNKDDKRSDIERLNELGKDGWEFVSKESNDAGTIYYFKRPLE